MPDNGVLPLEGIRVVDFTHVLAAPACGHLLARMGADVIKLESVSKGDSVRHRGGTDAARAKAGMSTSYLTQASGKRSVAVDLSSEDGNAIMRRLLSRADILVENHVPETMEALGLSREFLSAEYPGLIHCAVTGYGRGGPLENAPAYDINIQAASGLMALTGTAQTGPLRTGAPVIDYSTGLTAGFACLAALMVRQQTGRGTFVDVSMLDNAYALMASTVTDYLLTGHAPAPRGNAANSRSTAAGVFETADGLLSLGVNEEPQFVALCRSIGREELAIDTRFATRDARQANSVAFADELMAELAKRAASEWESLFRASGVPAARVARLDESIGCAHVRERGLAEDGGHGPGLSLPFRIEDMGVAPLAPAPRHGEHTREILLELGYRAEEITELSAAGIVRVAGDTTTETC